MRGSIFFASAAAALLAALPAAAQESMGERPAQGLFATRLFILKSGSAQKLAPIIENALRNASHEASAECAAQQDGKALLVSAPRSVMAMAEALTKSLDSLEEGNRPSAKDAAPGQEWSRYSPRFISAKGAAKLAAALAKPGEEGPEILFDPAAGAICWKRGEPIDKEVAELMAACDVPQTQTRAVFKAFRLNAKGVERFEKLLSEKPTGLRGMAFIESALLRAVATKPGSCYAGEAECAITQGVKFSEALLDAKSAGRFKITVSYPVVDAKPDGALSVYADFVFEYSGDIRNERWTLNSKNEIPIALFSLDRRVKDKTVFLNIASFEELYAPDGDLLVITAFAAAAPAQ